MVRRKGRTVGPCVGEDILNLVCDIYPVTQGSLLDRERERWKGKCTILEKSGHRWLCGMGLG